MKHLLHAKSLEYVSLPDSMETLHNGLFSGCGKLKSIKLPRNLKIQGTIVLLNVFYWKTWNFQIHCII